MAERQEPAAEQLAAGDRRSAAWRLHDRVARDPGSPWWLRKAAWELYLEFLDLAIAADAPSVNDWTRWCRAGCVRLDRHGSWSDWGSCVVP